MFKCYQGRIKLPLTISYYASKFCSQYNVATTQRKSIDHCTRNASSSILIFTTALKLVLLQEKKFYLWTGFVMCHAKTRPVVQTLFFIKVVNNTIMLGFLLTLQWLNPTFPLTVKSHDKQEMSRMIDFLIEFRRWACTMRIPYFLD